jgi:tetratricopeptide (TPR) repeat protein
MATDDAERLRARALTFVTLNRFEDAVFAYEELLEITPDDVTAILDLAYLYAHVVPGEGRGDALWTQALAIAPDSIDALFWHAYHDMIDGGTPEQRIDARQRLIRVIELDPSNRSGYVGCAHALLGQEAESDLATPERRCHLEAAVRASPDAPRFHQRLARAYERRGRLREALEHFEQALAQSHFHAEEPGDSRQRYKADVLEGRSVPRYTREELRGSIARVRQSLDAGGCRH